MLSIRWHIAGDCYSSQTVPLSRMMEDVSILSIGFIVECEFHSMAVIVFEETSDVEWDTLW